MIVSKKKVSNNSEIAQIFFDMADILELKKVKWKPRAYLIAGQTLDSLKKDVSQIYAQGGEKALMEIPGIGRALASKIVEYLGGNKIEEYEKVKKTIPPGLYEMMRVSGIGAKKASLFYNQLKIRNIDELYRAAEEHRINGLPGFKEKAEQKIIEGINLFKARKPKMSLKVAKKIANNILFKLKEIPQVKQAIIAGSIRRNKESVGDIDILIQTNKPQIVLDRFVKMQFVNEVLGRGKEKATVMTKTGVQVDVRVFTDEEFGAGLLYFTGDKQHNIRLRKIAIKNSLKLNEYGLFDKTGKRVAGKTEEEIYSVLGLKWIPPEKRIG